MNRKKREKKKHEKGENNGKVLVTIIKLGKAVPNLIVGKVKYSHQKKRKKQKVKKCYKK